jgi:hypothetical protein
MTTTLQLDPGTQGWKTSAVVNLQTTELNSLASGAAATSSVGGGGSNGEFSQTDFASAPMLEIWFTAGGAFTPSAGGALYGWFLKSPDGGTSFESIVATPSTTVQALSRSPDFVIPLDNAAYASGNIRFGGQVQAPAPTTKVVIQNMSGAALPASGNKVTAGPYTYQQV